MNRRTMGRLCSAALVGAVALVAGCKTMSAITDLGATVGAATGTLSPEEADAIRNTGAALAKALEQLTPEQEYYLGRTVVATLLTSYPLYHDEALTHYVNLVGHSVALVSDLPETFAGYRFAVLDSDEINAFAAPGGFILVTRGLLRVCNSEDALAGVLAHEVAHVQLRHGVRAIKTGRFTTAINTAAVGAATAAGGAEWAAAAEAYDAGVKDVVSTLVTGGYSRGQEREADLVGLEIMKRAGYDARSYLQVLRTMEEQLGHHPGGFGDTHPPPAARLKYLEQALKGYEYTGDTQVRQARFAQTMVRR